jgi:ribosomal-protein-alanine N-acetyltransferase
MNFLGSKTIETERLILHKTEEKDLKILWEILKDREVSKYYLTCKIHDDWGEEKPWQYKKLEKANNPDVFCWTIELKNTHEVIGQITCQENGEDKEIRDVGWFLDRKFQKKGYAYESAKAVLDYMFKEVNIYKIITCAAQANESSWRLMEKLGFKRLDTNPKVKYTFIDELVDAYGYEVNRKEYEGE